GLIARSTDRTSVISRISLLLMAERWQKTGGFSRLTDHKAVLEKEIGPLLGRGELADDDVISAFGKLLPGSPVIAQAEQRKLEAEAERKRLAEARARQKRLDSAWDPVEVAIFNIAKLRHMARFGRAHAGSTYNPAQAVRAAGNVQAAAAAALNDDYCPAKKGYVLATNLADFQARAKDHCDNDPPLSAPESGIPEVDSKNSLAA